MTAKYWLAIWDEKRALRQLAALKHKKTRHYKRNRNK